MSVREVAMEAQVVGRRRCLLDCESGDGDANEFEAPLQQHQTRTKDDEDEDEG